MLQRSLIQLLFIMMLASCDDEPRKEKTAEYEKGSLGYDLQFLQKHDSVIVLTKGESKIIISPKYQGKVFTSGAGGLNGLSFGWINYKAFDGPVDPHMNAYGGENRLWLGPEGGKFSLFFNPGDSMVFNNWKTPAAIDTEAWSVQSANENTVALQKQMKLKNYTGFLMDMVVDRTITILSKNEIEKSLDIVLGDGVQFTGYSTSNKLTNAGSDEWSEKTGMPCIWILDMFNPSDATTIVIPHKPAAVNEKIATTNYFGKIAADRINIRDSTLYFKADGKNRGKLGIVPAKVLPYAGSHDAKNNVLTITKFTVDNNARYLNQEWNTQKPVFSGDAMNAYNDGPLADGGQMGPFFEIESVSPAAALKSGEQLVHDHDVFHFTGNTEQLNDISIKILGVSLKSIQQVFNHSN